MNTPLLADSARHIVVLHHDYLQYKILNIMDLIECYRYKIIRVSPIY